VTRSASPSPAVLDIDGYSWRQALPSDGAAIEAIAAHGANRILFNLPATEAELAAGIGGPGFRNPMLCLQGSAPVGFGATTNRNVASQNLQVRTFYLDPAAAVIPLTTYVRHLFWSIALHRIYSQLPVVSGAEAYVRLFTGAGFQQEGVVRGHALVDDRPCDVVVLGLLRGEFEAWCQRHNSRLNM
jgi:hypothetical protein